MRQRGPVNLQEAFGFRFRVRFDPAYDAVNRPQRSLDPWMMVIPCRFGEIHPHGGSLLAWECEGHPKIRHRVERLDGVVKRQEGDDFTQVIFDVSQLDDIAAIVRPKRVRSWTAPELMQKRAAIDEINRQSTRK